MFKIGDIAVYPAHGVGVIESVETKNISGKEMSFLVMRILDNDMTIMIPTDKIEKVGLRDIIAFDRVDEIFDILRGKGEKCGGKTWNKRFRQYSEKLQSGTPTDIAEVLRDLMSLKNEKELSFGERKMLDNVRSLLSREIAVATNEHIDLVSKKLSDVFGSVSSGGPA